MIPSARMAWSNNNKTGFINDPLGQTHSLASSEHCFARFWKLGTDVRTTLAKTMILTGRDCGLADWIKMAFHIYANIRQFSSFPLLSFDVNIKYFPIIEPGPCQTQSQISNFEKKRKTIFVVTFFIRKWSFSLLHPSSSKNWSSSDFFSCPP